MPRFYFDTKDGGELVRDDTGMEFTDLAAVRRAAMAVLPGMASEELDGAENRVFVVRVRDERGATVFHASLALVADWID